MLQTAVAAFAAAAVIGLSLASTVLRGQLVPWILSLLHAAFGATGLVMILLTVMGGADGLVVVALALLFVAALGGFFLASYHLRKAPGPKPVVLIHAGVAVAGFLVLAGTAFHLV